MRNYWTAYIAIFIALAVVWYVMKSGREEFVPEFLDQGNVKRTSETRASSYAQRTNHFPMQQTDHDAVAGIETPFRVNMYSSYLPE